MVARSLANYEKIKCYMRIIDFLWYKFTTRKYRYNKNSCRNLNFITKMLLENVNNFYYYKCVYWYINIYTNTHKSAHFKILCLQSLNTYHYCYYIHGCCWNRSKGTFEKPKQIPVGSWEFIKIYDHTINLLFSPFLWYLTNTITFSHKNILRLIFLLLLQ